MKNEENRKSASSIAQQIERHLTSLQKERRASFLRQLRGILYLLRQGLPLRAHTENESNLYQLLRLCCDEIKWLNEKKYFSPDVVNEIIEMMAHKVLRELLEEIRKAPYFAIPADETRDISNREQLVICIRWVSENLTVREEPVGLLQVPDTKTKTVLSFIEDCLIRLCLPLTKCRGQAYDGAKNFQGESAGVAKMISDKVPAAISVHCLAHCVNLAVQESARSVKVVRDALDFAAEAIQLISASPKRQVLFEGIKAQNEDTASRPGIRPFCPTRWTVRASAMSSLLLNYATLQETFEEVSRGSDDYARRASGVVALMQRFSTYFGLCLALEMFSVTEDLSRSLQKKDTTCGAAKAAADVCTRHFVSQRTDEAFVEFFQEAEKKAETMCDEPRLPRYTRPPRRIDDGSAPHQHSAPVDYFRQQYFEAIDTVRQTIEDRFNQKNFLVVRQIEEVLASGGEGLEKTEIPKTYGADLDIEKLKLQLKVLPGALDGKNPTVMSTVSILKEGDSMQGLLSEVTKLVRLYLTVPVTTATAERSFSALKRVKTYLRNSMSQERLNHCFIMHVFKEAADRLEGRLGEVMEEFIGRNERRRNFFG